MTKKNALIGTTTRFDKKTKMFDNENNLSVLCPNENRNISVKASYLHV